MNAPEHRRSGRWHADPRLWLVAAFVLGALVAGTAVGLTTGDGATTTGPVEERSAQVQPPSPTPTVTTDAAPTGRLAAAKKTKPLTDLAPGDRVVYNMKACRFQGHVGADPEVSLISCRGTPDPFQVRTMTLVPVEVGGD